MWSAKCDVSMTVFEITRKQIGWSQWERNIQWRKQYMFGPCVNLSGLCVFIWKPQSWWTDVVWFWLTCSYKFRNDSVNIEDFCQLAEWFKNVVWCPYALPLTLVQTSRFFTVVAEIITAAVSKIRAKFGTSLTAKWFFLWVIFFFNPILFFFYFR